VPRRAAGVVADALADTRVVLVVGARQCGKSTLVRVVAQHRTAEWRNRDAVVTRQAAAADPSGFVAFPERSPRGRSTASRTGSSMPSSPMAAYRPSPRP